MPEGLKIIGLLAFLFMARTCFSQDPEFSQFYANPLYLNPALAGATSGPRIVAGYRNQWPGLGNAFVTYHASYDMYLRPLHGGVGLDITFDQAGGGNLNSFAISAMYAYKFNITERFQASGAVKAGYYASYLNKNNLTLLEPNDPYFYSLSASAGVPDFGAGIFLSFDNILYGGIAVDHLSQPNIGFSSVNPSPLYIKMTAHMGSVINLRPGGGYDDDREFSISPNVLYQQQFNFHQLNIGVYLTIDPIIAGVWFRHNFENSDAVIPLIGFHWKNLRVGYSYDYSLSKLKDASGGAHEVSASWQFAAIEKRREIRAIKCPRF
jgi:type IX secretion system PorP/SprF family membrane protein